MKERKRVKAAHLAGVDSDPHVHLLASVDVELADRDDHVQPHLNRANSMIRAGLWTAGNTIVTVTWKQSRPILPMSFTKAQEILKQGHFWFLPE